MKTTFVSTLAFVPLLTIVAATEISDVYKKTLGNSACTDINLTNGRVLHATCTNPGYGQPADFNLDLNPCFANYLGTLNQTPNGNGGFARSCNSCHMDGTRLACDCLVGQGSTTKHSVVELNDWNVIQVNQGHLSCSSTEGVEKRAIDKGARFFVA